MQSMNINYRNYGTADAAPVIVLPTCKGTIVIPVQQIIRIQAISNYSKLFFINNKSLVVAKVLHFFEDHPQLSSFVRIHRTHLVNTNHIKNYSGNKTGLLHLQNGELLFVAKRKKAILAGRLNSLNYCKPDEPSLNSSLYIKKILAA